MDAGYDERGSEIRVRVLMIYFISDLHLGASYVGDRQAHERRVVRFLDRIGSDATELYLLGDVLDYWYEYRTVVPRGYVRFFGALARLRDVGVKIVWLTGNHDIWLFDYLRDEIGIEVIDAPYVERMIGGHRFVLAHGDRIGKQKKSFKFICRLFRNKVCQKMYASIHPRWTIPFAHWWSSSSRQGSGEIEGGLNVRAIAERFVESLGAERAVEYVMLGHFHIVGDYKIEDKGCRVIVTGDWIENNSYAVFDGEEMKVKKFEQ